MPFSPPTIFGGAPDAPTRVRWSRSLERRTPEPPRGRTRARSGTTIYATMRELTSPTPFSTSHLTIISLSWGNYRCVSNRDNSAQSGESEPRPITGLAPPPRDAVASADGPPPARGRAYRSRVAARRKVAVNTLSHPKE